MKMAPTRRIDESPTEETTARSRRTRRPLAEPPRSTCPKKDRDSSLKIRVVDTFM